MKTIKKEYKYEKYKPVINEIEKEKYISRNLKLIIFVLLLLIIIIFIF